MHNGCCAGRWIASRSLVEQWMMPLETRQVAGVLQFSTLWAVDKQFVQFQHLLETAICCNMMWSLVTNPTALFIVNWLMAECCWYWGAIASSMHARRSINVSTLLNVEIYVGASAEFSREARDCWSSFLLIIKHRIGSKDFVLTSRFLRVLIVFLIVSCKALSYRE